MEHICPNSGKLCSRTDCLEAVIGGYQLPCDVYIGETASIITKMLGPKPPKSIDRSYLDKYLRVEVSAMHSLAKSFHIPPNIYIDAVIRLVQTDLTTLSKH
jgi:hypothetical protein